MLKTFVSAIALLAVVAGTTQAAETGTGNNAKATAVAGAGAASQGGNTNVNSTSQFPAQTAYAAATAIGSQVCMVSFSAGGQGLTIGLSMSAPVRDNDCVRRLNADAGARMGNNDLAKAILCLGDDVREAALSIGQPCPKDTQRAQAQVSSNVAPAAAAYYQQSSYRPTDATHNW